MQLATPSSEILTENTARIEVSFANLVKKVTETLERRKTDVQSFRLYILTIFKGVTIGAGADSVADIMEAVSCHSKWIFSCCTRIEGIAKEFAKGDVELSEWISKYKSELAGYKAITKIAKYIKFCDEEQEIADSGQSLDKQRYDETYYNRLSFKLKSHVMEKSLDYIDELWMSIADHFFLPPLSGLLDRIHGGCVEVTWLVSKASALKIKSHIENSVEFLEKLEVIRVVLDDEVLYESDKIMVRDS